MSASRVEEVGVPGATLWTVSRGVGLPVVLCHGGPGLSDNLAPVAEMVEDLALVHRYDQRGSGRSRSDGPFDVGSFVADLEGLRRHWGHKSWVVGGHSWGANLALLYALAHRDKTLGVIYLAGTGLTREFQDDVRTTRLARLTDDERAELAQLALSPSSDDSALTERFQRLMWMTDFSDRGTAERVLSEQPLYQFPRNEHVFRAASESLDAVMNGGLKDQVRELALPLLVVHGVDDTPARAREVAQTAPIGQWVQLEHSAHVPWLEEPLALREVLRGFVEQVSEPRS